MNRTGFFDTTLIRIYSSGRIPPAAFLYRGSFSSCFTWSSAQAKSADFRKYCLKTLLLRAPHKPRQLISRGLFPLLYGKLRANSGKSRSRLHTATGAAFSAPGRAPINRHSPRLALTGSDSWARWRSLAQPCARKPRNVSV